jgi:glyoxylase-like metal-dependent hydrolase (beta-lactamase superfamily II)
MTSQATQLTWDVYVTDLTPTASDDPPPGAKQFLWQPTSATLICGERDAVLVDALPTVSQARDLADWIAAHDKNLTAIYITHGHGDHWFGLSLILDRFPTARAFALPSVIEQMRQGSTPEMLAMWNGLFPGQIPDPLVLAEPLPDGTIDLEGHELLPVGVGHSDTDASTVLSAPDIGLVVAGDAVYNDVHQYRGSPARKADARGWPPWTPSSPCTRGPSLPGTSAPAGTTDRRSSRRPASTYATSTAPSRQRRRRGNCMTRSWRFTLDASTPACCGGQPARSSPSRLPNDRPGRVRARPRR